MEFDQDSRCRDDEDEDVRDAQVDQEDVCRVSEVFCLEDDVRYQHVPRTPDHQEDDADRGRCAPQIEGKTETGLVTHLDRGVDCLKAIIIRR